MDAAGNEDVVSKISDGEVVVFEDLVDQLDHSFVKNEGAKFEGGDGVGGRGRGR